MVLQNRTPERRNRKGTNTMNEYRFKKCDMIIRLLSLGLEIVRPMEQRVCKDKSE